MNKVWESIYDIFVGILIMFISVSVYFGLRTESVIKSMYEGITEEFITDVKRNGVFTLEDYEKYMERMGVGNNLFDISFEHRYTIYEPEYRFKTLEEIIADQNNAYTGANDYHYRDVVTAKPHVDDPINDGNLNTETNESVLAKAVDTPADSDHVHDENCYGGHKHVGEPLFTHTHRHDIYSCVQYRSVLSVKYTCSVCKTPHYITLATWYWDEESRSVKLGYSTGGSSQCYKCGSTNVTDFAYVESYAYSCGYNKDIDGDGKTDIVGYDNTYEYIRANAPNDLPSSTYVSGCYTYHKTKNMEFDLYNESSIRSAFSKMMYNDGFVGYCKVPEYIRIGISTDSYYREADISSLPNVCSILYRTYKHSNGSIRFSFDSYWTEDYGASRDNPGFPSDISVSQLIYYDDITQINNLFKQAINRDYYYSYSGNVSRHLNFFKRQWNSNGYYSWLEDKTQYLYVCDYDHSLGVDKWLTTCGLEEDGTIDCNKIIVSLTPTHSTQTVYTNDPLITTAKAIYKDSSEKTVVCVSDFDTSLIGKDQAATLTYTYLIGEMTFTKTCMIEVTVIPRNKTCSHGHIYNLNADGSDSGCPYCRAWIDNLRVINPTTSPIVITIGTTLQNNNVVLLATYMDGHIEEVPSGYIDNLDTLYLGTKPVTIGYKGASVTVLVTTRCATMICDICGYEYNLYPDGTNPGCPRCISKIPVFTGNIMEYERVNHTEEILDVLYVRKQYIFNVDDVFSVVVKNKSSTVARKVLKKIYPSLTDRWINIEKREHVMSR